MKLPIIEGIIRRRMLVNFRVDPSVMQAQLPSRFTPKLQGGHAIAGVCLIRLEQIRPKGLPSFLGISSENAAHRVAVKWKDDAGQEKEGVFIPRRDTGSWLNSFAGGRLFPGEHHLARFNVQSTHEKIDFQMRSTDGMVEIGLKASRTDTFPKNSCFGSLAAASSFFECGSCGFSVTREPSRLDGISLKTSSWDLMPLAVQEARSSYFEAEKRFPKGSVEFDCALLMENVGHEWHTEPDLYV